MSAFQQSSPGSQIPQRFLWGLWETGGSTWLLLPLLPMVTAVSPSGADPEETILNAFKVFDPEGKGLKSA